MRHLLTNSSRRLAAPGPSNGLRQALRDWSRSVGLRYMIPSGTIAVRQGELAATVLLLESGQVLLQRVERDGTEVALALSAAGAFLGLASAVRRAPSATSAVARADSLVVAISLDRLHEALTSPQLAPAIIEQLALEQVTLIERYGALAALPVRDRVLALLREMTPADVGLPWPIHLSTTDLANLAGADGSSVCRILRTLRAEGRLSYRRGRIALLVP